MRRVVITGIGIVSSIGNNPEEVRKSLFSCTPGISKAIGYEDFGFKSQVYGSPNIDLEQNIDRRKLRFLADGSAWAYIAAEQAIKDSNLENNEISNEKTGLIVGTGGPSARAIVKAADQTRARGAKHVGPFAVPKAMCSMASATLSTYLGIKGVNYSISSACATSNNCIGSSYELIKWGSQDVMVAGGAEELDWSLSVLFDGMGAMSSNFNENPIKASRAYDINRDGFVIAGGAGILILEEYERAISRGAKIYAEIAGYGSTSDGNDMVLLSGEGAERAMKNAMKDINSEIDYINPHATSTPQGDIIEANAMRNVFGSKMPVISATKSLSGHSLGAAGAQEAIYSLIMMKNNFICRSANIDSLDPNFDDLPIALERHDDIELNTVMSNAFGFGGTNACLVFRKVN
ncbi:MAG: beta-ketoacyl-ACP synthase I [Hyphomicrobiales bacterium]|jgi:3-oxoacyl-[acyl-carrier-protein] synthase I|nr:beta-ketoacyl-ACP synthase I [Hyphomicrobiales bacterium]|tara:strand:+ start:687 stop:1901 length:1215 start_codon:yes stop_codon:yes gene_type:complete